MTNVIKEVQATSNLDSQLRSAVREVMTAEVVKPSDLAKVQELLDRKAASARAPFSEKVRRIKERTREIA
jgi:hypothetical protein